MNGLPAIVDIKRKKDSDQEAKRLSFISDSRTLLEDGCTVEHSERDELI